MNVTLLPSKTGGKIKAIASKSVAHRMLICASFANAPTEIICEEINEDISATADCLSALGANIQRQGKSFFVTPVEKINIGTSLNCRESGSTLRFLLPVAAALGADASFLMSGRLPMRPLSPLREELEVHGFSMSKTGTNPLSTRGSLDSMNFKIDGNVSSQFISGLLFAIAVSKNTGSVEIVGALESAPYIDLTVNALAAFCVVVKKENSKFIIEKNDGLVSPKHIEVEGDWSNAAFPLCLGALGQAPITLTGVNNASPQGDRQIISLLEAFGAKIECREGSVTVYPSRLQGIEIDASQIPDLVPILATVGAAAEGRTVIKNASRLRIKESDRLVSTSKLLNSLGAFVKETEDGLVIEGGGRLVGGSVSSFGDHRIAMSAAVASVMCDSPVEIVGAEAANKSYPDFWRHLEALGAKIKFK